MHNGFLQDGQDYSELQMNDIFQNTSEKKKKDYIDIKGYLSAKLKHRS